MEFTREQLLRLATLARLRLTDAEADAMTHDLSAILAHAHALDAVDTSGVAPTTHAPALPQLARMPLRDDAPAPRLTREQVLSNAPASHDDMFRLPRVVDHG
jgi:aspartyl-tRNA(Asn)/glutamyl-tRNA(Gln) amidotransferase subunit C